MYFLTTKEAKFLEQRAEQAEPMKQVINQIAKQRKKGSNFIKFSRYYETLEFWTVRQNKEQLQNLGYTLELIGNSYYIKW